MSESKRRKNIFSSAYRNVAKHSQSSGEQRKQSTETPKPQTSLPGSDSNSNSRAKNTSVDTAIRVDRAPVGSTSRPQSASQPSTQIPLVEDFQTRYNAQPGSGRPPADVVSKQRGAAIPQGDHPNAPDFSGMDDEPSELDAADRDAPLYPTNQYTTSRDDVSLSSRRARSRSKPRNDTSHIAQQQKSDGTAGRPLHLRRPSNPNESAPASPSIAHPIPRGPGDRSSGETESVASQETSATSIHTLPPLQSKGPDNSDAQQLQPLMEDDPRSFDLVDAVAEGESGPTGEYAMERRSDQMFAAEHLQTIFDDPKLLLKFTGFLNSHRPQSIPILIYYLDALKALRAIRYANAIAEALEPLNEYEFTENSARPTANDMLEEKANRAFEVMVRDDLPAYITHTWIQVVSTSIQRRVTGTLAPHLREASEGLAEVFCLTDPSRPDNPIVFASEEFARTTQYGMNYTIGRNCRFLQGPRTNPHSVRRLAEACIAGKEHSEVFVNYRRDGNPFMNLLMIAPLMDSRGSIRYFIGAQVDVSGLIKDCSELEGLARMVERDSDPETAEDEAAAANAKDEFQELSEMFNGAELDTVRRHGGRMHKEYEDESADRESLHGGRPRLLLKDPSQDLLDRQRDSMASQLATSQPNHNAASNKERFNGRLEGVYQHYLLIRPSPSLRILFTSPSLRVPGILQSPFLHRIGGSPRVRTDLSAALSEGRGVTAKIRWLTRADEAGEGEGRPRWIHCTPLLGHSGAVGVWMVVLVDEEGGLGGGQGGRRFRAAPPVSSVIGGKEWGVGSHAARERRGFYEQGVGGNGSGGLGPQPGRGGVGGAGSGGSLYSGYRQGTHGGGGGGNEGSEFSFGLK